MTSRARLSQERSRRRKETLLAAALEVFLEGGSRAVTHRAVSARADLPPATTTYYFASIDLLLQEALRGMFDEWEAQLEEAAARIEKRSLEEVLEYLATTVSRRTGMNARNEIAVYVEAAATPELAELAKQTTQRFSDFVHRQIASTGIDNPDPLAAAIALTINGSALQQAAGAVNAEGEMDRLLPIFRRLAAAHLLDDDEIENGLAKAD